jgi:adenosylcobinamide kinase/adenosylcobinamide-phosphate guanylyltransferase
MRNVLVIGGAASGKSGLAEGIVSAAGLSRRFYIATMMPFGGEGQARIAKHRASRRELGFETVERYTDIGGLILPERGAVLLEDIGNLVANELFGDGGDFDKLGGGLDKLIAGPAERIVSGVLALAEKCGLFVVVTNDVSRDGVRYDAETAEYIRVIGLVNRRLAARFDEVYEAAAGFLLQIK